MHCVFWYINTSISTVWFFIEITIVPRTQHVTAAKCQCISFGVCSSPGFTASVGDLTHNLVNKLKYLRCYFNQSFPVDFNAGLQKFYVIILTILCPYTIDNFAHHRSVKNYPTNLSKTAQCTNDALSCYSNSNTLQNTVRIIRSFTLRIFIGTEWNWTRLAPFRVKTSTQRSPLWTDLGSDHGVCGRSPPKLKQNF